MERLGVGGGRTSRRRWLGGAGAGLAGVVAARVGDHREGFAAMRQAKRQGMGTPVSEEGHLLARPGPVTEAAAPGLRPLGLDARRDALLFVPAGYDPTRPAPFVLSMHGAGGDANGSLYPLHELADAAGLVLLAPASRGRTWDVILGGYGPDVAFLDRALAEVFARVAVDPARIGVAGFSDGASYALSLGITNGDLFGHVLAFSPGFAAPAAQRGEPRFFVSHGTGDEVLAIDRTSRRIVPQLERAGYDVDYREFDGGHTVPPEMARAALERFLASPATPVPG